LLVGNELAVALFIHPVLYSVDDGAHTRVVKPLAGRLGRFMPFWYAAALIFALLQLFLTGRAQTVSWWLCLIAAILLALIIILTILLPVPLNNRIAAWDLRNLPHDWLATRRRWDLYHQVRVLLLVFVFTLLTVSALFVR
jgi:Domain of unknown function (DUF1772)